MKEYIEREALIAEIDDRIADIGFTSPYQDDIALMLEGMVRVRDSVEVFPAADVVERKRGEWIEEYDEYWEQWRLTCPHCRNDYISITKYLENYCSNCGADMRGG